MKRSILIGVDGGGTKSTAVAVDTDGKILGRCTGEGINFYAIGMEKARGILSELITRLLKQIEATVYDSLYIGMSALSKEPTKCQLEGFCGECFPAERVYMCSDIIAALYGFTLGAPGVLIISGTGMIGAAINCDKTIISGGWGYLLGDEGSCYYIGLEGIKAAMRDIEGVGMPTSLSERLLPFYKADNLGDFFDYIYKTDKHNEIIASFAHEVIKAYRESDMAACSIIEKTISILVLHTQKLLREINFDSAKVGVYGGLFEKNQDIFKIFQNKLQRYYRNVSVEIPAIPPEIGAILLGLSEKKPQGWQQITERLSAQFMS